MRFRVSWGVGSLLLFIQPLAAETVPPLPAPVNINQDAGCYNLMFVTVELQNGKDLPFLVDTGCPYTVLDQSLRSELGKRLDTAEVSMQPGVQKSGCYPAPRFYLGNTQLMTGSNVWTLDLSWASAVTGHHFMGVLGMDCLRHYCVQLDFKAGRMRFLDPAHLDITNLGQAFSLNLNTNAFNYGFPFIRGPGLLGGTNGIVYIDTGDNGDAEVKKEMVKGHHFIRFASVLTKGITGIPVAVPLKQCVWNGNTYTNLGIGRDRMDRIGIRFLARHIVTLDFPDRKLYLKQITTGPRERTLSVHLPGEVRAAAELLLDLDNNDQLPGWSRTDHGTVSLGSCSKYGGALLGVLANTPLKSVTINFQKRGDSTVYRYTVSRWSAQSEWLLQRAWQVDSNGKMIKEFPIAFPAFPPSNSRKIRTIRYF
ncbi:MAG TPA: retropepsin-like aspartic protease [Alphaproteobacteria bacterium]|nr:retropepsin-like aspartic protease [Alphaproteobacteria bacterium]